MRDSGKAKPMVVVAGATGYLGGHVVAALHEAGYPVRALVRDPKRLGARRALCTELFLADARDAARLAGLCDGAGVVFSSVGIRTFRRRPTFWEVDYKANRNLVECARSAGARHFIFVSVVNGQRLRRRVPLAEARERVMDHLQSSGMRWTVMRPTGFFNDMADFFAMARRGTAYLVGRGTARVNPIHGADLAAEIVRAIEDQQSWNRAVAVGGPDLFTMRQIAELAFEVLGKPARIRLIPPWLLRAAGSALRPLNANASSLLCAMSTFGNMDYVGTPCGTHHLRAFFQTLAQEAQQSFRGSGRAVHCP